MQGQTLGHPPEVESVFCTYNFRVYEPCILHKCLLRTLEEMEVGEEEGRDVSHRQRDAVREMTAETDGGGGGEWWQMGEDEKWSTWERQKDEGESKTAWTEDAELKRKPGRRQDRGQTGSNRGGLRHLRSITRPVRDAPNIAPA